MFISISCTREPCNFIHSYIEHDQQFKAGASVTEDDESEHVLVRGDGLRGDGLHLAAHLCGQCVHPADMARQKEQWVVGVRAARVRDRVPAAPPTPRPGPDRRRRPAAGALAPAKRLELRLQAVRQLLTES